ncbi:MAG: hypothetical protein MZV49_17340 [Rhodopseudomonas palustris]|nr:hypothetical protein [Rhodopseudomonas palustris]
MPPAALWCSRWWRWQLAADRRGAGHDDARRPWCTASSCVSKTRPTAPCWSIPLRDSKLIDSLAPGSSGFVRVVMRGTGARAPSRRCLAQQPPFRLGAP